MAEEQAPSVRQRKKRKWDQPAETLVPPAMPMPLPGLMQFGGTNPLAAYGMPNMLSMMGSYMGLPMAPVNMPGASALTPNNSAAAIVQKINQELVAKGLMLPSKVHDEVISREIVINDADSGMRYKLTKRQTQEEIQAKTGAVVITRGRFRPPNGPPDSEKPLYLHISAGVQLKDTAERIKAVDAATALVEEMMKQGPPSAGVLQSGGGGSAFSAVVNVGIEADPSFNLVGRIRGPNDQYIKHIMTETGAEVAIRGRGSGYIDPSTGQELQQPLHLLISSENAKNLDDARRLSENLLDTIRADNDSLRPATPQPILNGPPPIYNHGGTPHAPDTARSYAHHQSSSEYSMQVGSQRVHFQASGYISGSQPAIPGALSQAAAPAVSLMDPYANMRPPSKSYAAVPPPQQFLAGGALDSTTDSSSSQRSGADDRSGGQKVEETPTTSTSSMNNVFVASVATSAANVSGISTSGPCQPLLGASYRPQNTSPYYQAGAAPYSNPSYPGNVPAQIYGGYGGVYPQVSPLQQVSSVLHRPPLPVSVKPGFGVAGVVPPGTEVELPGDHSGHSNRQMEKISNAPVQKERRKFQEFPVAAKGVASEVFQQHQITGPAKLNSTGSAKPTASVKMPPPPPKFIAPPPKFTSSSGSVDSVPTPSKSMSLPSRGSSEPEQDGLKLVEYGEDEDEPSVQNMDRAKAENSFPSLHPNGKPFWAAP